TGTAAATHIRILVADDNADMREYVTRLLRSRWEVEAVADGHAALAALRARPADLVLSDVMMPGPEGFALPAAVRERTVAGARARGAPRVAAPPPGPAPTGGSRAPDPARSRADRAARGDGED